MTPTFFATAAAFRKWLARHHDDARELWVGYYRKGSGRPSLTWPESVDEALCFGWIDGVRRSVDDVSYAIRFTPRRPGSVWSAVNVARAKALARRGRMRPTGLAAFAARANRGSEAYSYEQRRSAALDRDQERRFRANAKAWAFFQSQPPWYRRTASFWVVSAKKEETRERRLATLIGDSENGRVIGPLARPDRRR